MKRKLLLSITAVGILAAPVAFAQGPQGGGDRKGKMMQAIDTNGDGQISKGEFMAKHEERFDEMDADHDGSLSKEEMKSAWESRKGKFKEMREKRGDGYGERKRLRMRDGTGPHHGDIVAPSSEDSADE